MQLPENRRAAFDLVTQQREIITFIIVIAINMTTIIIVIIIINISIINMITFFFINSIVSSIFTTIIISNNIVTTTRSPAPACWSSASSALQHCSEYAVSTVAIVKTFFLRHMPLTVMPHSPCSPLPTHVIKALNAHPEH